jgi:hypothetical protein
VLDHAQAAGDGDLTDFVRRAFEWGITKGDALVGYFPEHIEGEGLNVNVLDTSELCEVADMIGLAIKLSAAGLGDYWDDADRWLRNQFAEGQLLRVEWIHHMAQAVWIHASPDAATIDQVPERNIGAFAGWSTANDWLVVGKGTGIMHCCTGNATRALYYIWEHILTVDNGTLSVNLLLNRPSQWADVHSHIPYTGQVDVIMKQAHRLRVRVPEWVAPQEATCMVNGVERALGWDGRYALIGEVDAQDEVTLAFPITERKQETDIQHQHYQLITRGNEVVDIYPRGRYFPLYQRDYYRNDRTRWKKVDRFVSDQTIRW